MAEIPHKTALSGKLLTMKFMQRQQEQETRDRLVSEQNRIVTEAHWVIDQANVDLPKPKFQVAYEPSFLQMNATERSSVGRMSFQKFNSVVEKSAAQAAGEQQLDRELKRQRQSEISDDEMAKEMGRSNKAKKAKEAKSSNGGGQSKKPTSNRRAPPKPSGGSGKAFMKPKE
ncbi:M-phase phosphoprotein 6 [Linnemannia exigua]|uniref:M-phase phosphoprotein 6 n=1 Tax=Linnemannia exigua TaxID=604196 RepID=A0AAD4DKB4_9FUNG|nr:M-phase phosphoprotein 6 [Linnemannia exigua]